MKLSRVISTTGGRLTVILVGLILSFTASAATTELLTPKILIVDKSLAPQQLKIMESAARRYDTFWNTGEEALAREALSATFIDKTLPSGRKQGPDGPLLASMGFRKSIPDLTCEIEQMVISGDRVVAHLRFRGHFTGTFEGTQGQGQKVDFIATDIYQIENGKITANWHIEDNLTLMKQLGKS